MKICHLTSVHSHIDTRIFVKECSTLAEKGFEVLLIAPNAPNEILNGVQLIGIEKIEGNRLKRMISTTRKVYQKAIELDSDIYHFHDPELIPVGLKLKKLGKIVIYDVHEDLPRQILSKNWIPKFFRKPISLIMEYYETIVSRKFDGIITATDHIKNRFINYNKNTITINNFPSLKEMQFNFLPWNEKEGVCYIGGITEVRGAFEMVEMLGHVNYNNLKLNLGGPIDKKIKYNLERNKYWKFVEYKGILSRSEVKELLNKSKVGLVTLHPIANYLDALPVKMFEYMAAGIPVIASNFPLWSSIIEKHECGVCVNPKNPKEIAEAVDFLLKNPNIAERMGRNGRKAVESKYNWEKEGQKLVDFYRKFS
ncbi:glycosyltransferase family 4 protein [Ureibacillus thermosphaericus]|uniref:glycosyltransferase family 4 protein n=1 Tax=Ureibacillus thermosphaericus TaxID=51173 RepID=UPI000310F2A8|nr:glycosyltransferase family 4 protein [Ureibacillus thermosphaericus]